VARVVIPIVPIIIVASAVLRGLGKGGGRPVSARTDPRIVNFAVRMLACMFLAPLLGKLAAQSLVLGSISWAALVIGSFPSLVLSRVLIPLGLVRAAYWFASVSPPLAHAGESAGGAVLAGVLALGTRRAAEPSMLSWLDVKLRRLRSPRGLAISAAGLLEAARKNDDGARAILRAVTGISPRSSNFARGVARSWLVADAAQRGDWADIAELGMEGVARRWLRWPYLMGLIAQRLVADPASPSDAALVWAWLIAPHRRATFPLLRRALSTSPRAPHDPAVVDLPAEGGELLAAALRAHAMCLAEPGASSLVVAGQAWDAVRSSPAVASLVARRALAIEAQTTPEAALASLLSSAEDDLSRAVVQANLAPEVASASPTLTAALAAARRRAMDDIESLATALAQRTKDRRELAAPGEWMEWGSLRGFCDRATRDAPVTAQRTVFEAVYTPACNYAVWLHNARDQKVLANAIFRWLAARARSAGNVAAVELLENNAKLGEGA
jgi:hypothetical protein